MLGLPVAKVAKDLCLQRVHHAGVGACFMKSKTTARSCWIDLAVHLLGDPLMVTTPVDGGRGFGFGDVGGSFPGPYRGSVFVAGGVPGTSEEPATL